MATTRAYGTCKAIRGSLVGHRGLNKYYMYAEKRRTACLQEVLSEMQSLLHDDPERRIVVIIRLLKQEGILCTNSLYEYRAWLCKVHT